MPNSPRTLYSQIIKKLYRTCEKHDHHFNELIKIKEKLTTIENRSQGSEIANLEAVVAFMKEAKSDELAIKLVYLSFMRDLEAFKRNGIIENLDGDYLT